MKSTTFLRAQLQKPVVVGAILVLITLIVALFIRYGSSSDTVVTESQKKLVEVSSPAKLAGGEELSLIGTVRAFTEAQITAERTGRITRVNAELGKQVSAGQILVTLENASESAAVLQAQGAYEGALAAARQSSIGVDEAQNAVNAAENNLVNSIKSSYNTTNAVVLNDIDDFFSNPNAGVPGLKIDGKGTTQTLNAERVAYQSLLPQWQLRSNTVTVSSNLTSEVDYAVANVNRTISFLDSFITLFGQQNGNDRYSDAELQSFTANFSGLRSSLLQTVSALENAETGVANANEVVTRATLSASGGGASAADAQVKQALGSLRSAQANYAKTVLRSPISGTVNALSAKLGDYANTGQVLAIIANNNALEIVTFAGDQEAAALSPGDEVLIEGVSKGIVTNVAPAVDATTKKTEIRIATDDSSIANGDTVRITKNSTVASSSAPTEISIPLSAVKFETNNGFIMQVENGVLVQKSVELGSVRGTSLEIISGLSATEEFVVDVRGLTPGTEVTVKN